MRPTAKQLRYLNTTAILRGEESVIGRSDYSSIIIAHPSVSRLHATIIHREGETFIRDLGSRNGTFVNGARVHDTLVRIEVGDEVRIGNVNCVLENTADCAHATIDVRADRETDG